MQNFQKFGILGAGAWGTALSLALLRAGREVTLWVRNPELATKICQAHENITYLPGITLPETLHITHSLEAIAAMDALLIVVPSQFARNIMHQLKAIRINKHIPIILCCKGVEQGSLKIMTEVAEEEFPHNPVVVLSGPTFAIEVAKGLPASVSLACKEAPLCKQLKQAIESENFKVFPTNDLIGAEIGGAIKNVIAIACGIAEGSGLGQNAKAALITRGVQEMRKLCRAKGGRRRTLMQLCGIGDLILTANSQTSRNFSLGYALGQGKQLEEIINSRVSVAEGVASSSSVVMLAEKLHVNLPICNAVYRIVHGHADIKTTIEQLVRES